MPLLGAREKRRQWRQKRATALMSVVLREGEDSAFAEKWGGRRARSPSPQQAEWQCFLLPLDIVPYARRAASSSFPAVANMRPISNEA